MAALPMPVAVPITMPSTSPIAQPVRQCSVAVAAIAQVTFMVRDYTPWGYKRRCAAGLGSETGGTPEGRDQATSATRTNESVLTTAWRDHRGPDRAGAFPQVGAHEPDEEREDDQRRVDVGEAEDGRADQPGEHGP